MPAPAAPRKKGALTSSTVPRTTRTASTAVSSNAAASERPTRSTEADLAERLEQVSLSNGAAPRRPATSSSRLQATETSSSKASSSAAKTAASRTASPPATLETLLPTVNNTLAKLSEARKKATPPFDACISFVKAVQDATPALSVSLGRLRALCTAPDDKAESHTKSRLLSVERAAILLVSHCLDAGLFEIAVPLLGSIRESLIGMYSEAACTDTVDNLLTKLQGLKVETSSSRSVSRSTSTASAPIKRASSSAASRLTPSPSLMETASLLSFPPFPQEWKCQFSAQEVCTSILIMQNQVLSCLYGLPVRSPSRTSRISTNSSTSSRATPSGLQLNEQNVEMRPSIVLAALENESGNPLATFRAAVQHMQPDERTKTEHYISTIYSLVMKRTSELAASETVPPLVTVKLHFYALECLLENQSYFALAEQSLKGVTAEDKPVNSLTSSLYRAIVAFGKSSTAHGIAETELASQISHKVLLLIRRFHEVITPEERLSSSKTYIEVMDLLIQLFDKGKLDVQQLRQHIEISPKFSSASSSLGVSKTSSRSPQDIEREASRLCTCLSSQVTSLEKWTTSSYVTAYSESEAIRELLNHAAQFLLPDTMQSSDPNICKLRKNMIRSMERFHHYAYRAYKYASKDDSTSSNPNSNTSEPVAVLKVLLASFCEAAEAVPMVPELHSRAIDTLLLLARHEFRLYEPASYKKVYAYIQRCSSLLAASDGSNPPDPRMLGTIASSAYSIGRTLYNNEKYANAVPFLTISCVSTDSMVEACQLSGSTECLTNLFDKSASRWELLGSAHTHCKETQDALDAYSSCLRMLYRQWNGRDEAELSLDPAFMRVLSKYTKLSVLDLLSPPERSSIVYALSSTSIAQLSDLARGHLLHAQSSCLREYLHKAEALHATLYWLDESITAFEGCQAKSELARILVRRMQLAVEYGEEGASGKVTELAERVITVCESETSAPWSAECLASSKLLSALDKIRMRDVNASKVLGTMAKEALALLRISLLADKAAVKSTDLPCNQEGKNSTKRPHLSTEAKLLRTAQQSKAPHSATAAATVRKPLSPKAHIAQRAKETVTPPRNTKRDIVGDLVPPRQATASKLRSPSVSEDFIGLLDTIACVLGLFEHTFLRIGYLRFLKHLWQNCSAEHYVKVCIDLAHEYQQLGKQGRAEAMLSQAQAKATSGDVTGETRTLLMLRKAEHLALMGFGNESYAEYMRALTNTERLISHDTTATSRSRILSRTSLLCGTAQVAESFAIIIENQGNSYEAMTAAMQALRLCNRALANLSRLVSSNAKGLSAEDSATSNPTPGFDARESSQGRLAVHSTPNVALGWRISQLLSRILLRLAHLYQIRGTIKLAAYFYQQAVELADSVGAPRLKAKILAKQIHLARAANRDLEAQEKLALLTQIASAEGGLSTIEILHLNGQAAAQQSDFDGAEKAFSTALNSLTKLEKAFKDTECQFPSPIRNAAQASQKVSPPTSSLAIKNEFLLPCMQSSILEQYITMFNSSGQFEKMAAWLAQLSNLSRTSKLQLEDSILQTKLRLSEVFMDIRQDPIAGLLRESVLSIPVLTCFGQPGPPEFGTHFLQILSEIELDLLGSASSYQVKASPPRWRDVSGAIAHLRMLQANMGRSDALCAIGVASALESGIAVTARREMLEVLHSKLTHGILRDDLVWPRSQPRLTSSKPLSAHWKDLETRYMKTTTQGMLPFSDIGSLLPSNWSVLSLHVTPDEESLLAVQHTPGNCPLILQLPFDRISRREGDDSLFNLQAAKAEMSNIIYSANATSQNAKNVTSLEDRRSWWTERKALDRRLAAILVNIEKRWLGAYKNVLVRGSRRTSTSVQKDETRQAQLLAVIEKAILNSRDNKPTQLKLESALIDAFFSLSTDAEDDDLEDWLHFIVDSLQFAGVRVACDEIDLDQAVVDLRSLLEERSDEASQEHDMLSSSDLHLFLVLDKGLHSFPWESLPCLANISVSRLPSLDFLQDRLDSSKHQHSNAGVHPGLKIDQKKAFYVLNPGGDLKHTQREFQNLLENGGWSGIVERAPMEEELRRSLSTQDIFLYLGHGGAEQYIRPHVLQALPSCATTFLWGCSSGHLREQGEFEETGTPLVYMQAGAPAVVGNLWDVTDKDLDRYTHSTLEKFGLFKAQDKAMSLPRAIAASRGACSLRYLNGAAPVVWGLPVTLTS